MMEIDWQEKTLDELCSLRREFVEPSASGVNKYVGLEHIESGIPRIRRWGTDEGLRSTKNRFYNGDVLYGKLRPYLDKAALAEWNGVCSTDILTLEPHQDSVDSAYLSFLLHTSEFLAHAVATTSGVNHPRTSWASLASFSHPIPSLPEQRAIATVLAKIQAAVEVQDKIVATLKELKAATMAKLFREGLRGEPLKQTEIGEIPESWGLKPIGELFEIQLGKMLSPKARSGRSPVPYLRNANVQWGRIDFSDLYEMDFSETELEKFSLRPGDLLVCEGGEVGRTAIWNGELEKCSYQKALHRLRPIGSQKVLPKFYMYWAEAAFTVLKTHAMSEGTKTTIAHLPAVKLASLLMPVPSLEQQHEIVRIFDVIDVRMRYQEERCKKLKMLFSSMLHLLMTGQIRVKLSEEVLD